MSTHDIGTRENEIRKDQNRNTAQQIQNDKIVKEKDIALELFKAIQGNYHLDTSDDALKLYEDCYRTVKKI